MRPDRWHLYRLMFESRLFEESIRDLWNEGRISGEMHLGIGEEGIVAGVVDHLRDGDAIAGDHRSTAPFVMRGVDPVALVAECLGSEAGLGRGAGGHMHLFSKAQLAASSGIVGASGPLACGFALSHRHLRPGSLAVALFGEGAMNQGMLLESLNLAATWSLPVVFVCKDNGMAITTPSADVTSGDVVARARAFGLTTREANGEDVESVWSGAAQLVDRARSGAGPGFLYATCVRPEGHFLGDPLLRLVRKPGRELRGRGRPLLDAVMHRDGAGWTQRLRSLGTIASLARHAAAMRGHDPVTRLRERLVHDVERLEQLERETTARVRSAVSAAVDAVGAPA